MRIYLLGFMGSGKTTLGKKVAARLDVTFVDTDEWIISKEGMSIQDIFRHHGESHFRSIEATVLRKTAEYDKALIATGGGTPVHDNNMEWLLQHGVTIFLRWPEDLLIASLLHHRSIRPLLSSLTDVEAASKAMELLHERIPVYERSAMTIEMTGDETMDEDLLTEACKYIW